MVVNVENINKVIAQLRNEAAFFDMRNWDSYKCSVEYPDNICGTPSCIGGWAESIMRFENKTPIDTYVSSHNVGRWLGINTSASTSLFFPEGEADRLGVYQATKEDAIAVLENLIETGEVDWIKILKEKQNG